MAETHTSFFRVIYRCQILARVSQAKVILHVEKFGGIECAVSSDGDAVARSNVVALQTPSRFSATIIMSVFPFTSAENLNGNVVLG